MHGNKQTRLLPSYEILTRMFLGAWRFWILDLRHRPPRAYGCKTVPLPVTNLRAAAKHQTVSPLDGCSTARTFHRFRSASWFRYNDPATRAAQARIGGRGQSIES